MKLQKKQIITSVLQYKSSICIDSIIKIDKKNYPQFYLEQCKYKIKKRKMVDFINAELDVNSDNSE